MPKTFIYAVRNYGSRKTLDEYTNDEIPPTVTKMLTRSVFKPGHDVYESLSPWHQGMAKRLTFTASRGGGVKEKRKDSGDKTYHHLSLVTRFYLGLRMTRLKAAHKAKRCTRTTSTASCHRSIRSNPSQHTDRAPSLRALRSQDSMLNRASAIVTAAVNGDDTTGDHEANECYDKLSKIPQGGDRGFGGTETRLTNQAKQADSENVTNSSYPQQAYITSTQSLNEDATLNVESTGKIRASYELSLHKENARPHQNTHKQDVSFSGEDKHEEKTESLEVQDKTTHVTNPTKHVMATADQTFRPYSPDVLKPTIFGRQQLNQNVHDNSAFQNVCGNDKTSSRLESQSQKPLVDSTNLPTSLSSFKCSSASALESIISAEKESTKASENSQGTSALHFQGEFMSALQNIEQVASTKSFTSDRQKLDMIGGSGSDIRNTVTGQHPLSYGTHPTKKIKKLRSRSKDSGLRMTENDAIRSRQVFAQLPLSQSMLHPNDVGAMLLGQYSFGKTKSNTNTTTTVYENGILFSRRRSNDIGGHKLIAPEYENSTTSVPNQNQLLNKDSSNNKLPIPALPTSQIRVATFGNNIPVFLTTCSLPYQTNQLALGIKSDLSNKTHKVELTQRAIFEREYSRLLQEKMETKHANGQQIPREPHHKTLLPFSRQSDNKESFLASATEPKLFVHDCSYKQSTGQDNQTQGINFSQAFVSNMNISFNMPHSNMVDQLNNVSNSVLPEHDKNKVNMSRESVLPPAGAFTTHSFSIASTTQPMPPTFNPLQATPGQAVVFLSPSLRFNKPMTTPVVTRTRSSFPVEPKNQTSLLQTDTQLNSLPQAFISNVANINQPCSTFLHGSTERKKKSHRPAVNLTIGGPTLTTTEQFEEIDMHRSQPSVTAEMSQIASQYHSINLLGDNINSTSVNPRSMSRTYTSNISLDNAKTARVDDLIVFPDPIPPGGVDFIQGFRESSPTYKRASQQRNEVLSNGKKVEMKPRIKHELNPSTSSTKYDFGKTDKHLISNQVDVAPAFSGFNETNNTSEKPAGVNFPVNFLLPNDQATIMFPGVAVTSTPMSLQTIGCSTVSSHLGISTRNVQNSFLDIGPPKIKSETKNDRTSKTSEGIVPEYSDIDLLRYSNDIAPRFNQLKRESVNPTLTEADNVAKALFSGYSFPVPQSINPSTSFYQTPFIHNIPASYRTNATHTDRPMKGINQPKQHVTCNLERPGTLAAPSSSKPAMFLLNQHQNFATPALDLLSSVARTPSNQMQDSSQLTGLDIASSMQNVATISLPCTNNTLQDSGTEHHTLLGNVDVDRAAESSFSYKDHFYYRQPGSGKKRRDFGGYVLAPPFVEKINKKRRSLDSSLNRIQNLRQSEIALATSSQACNLQQQTTTDMIHKDFNFQFTPQFESTNTQTMHMTSTVPGHAEFVDVYNYSMSGQGLGLRPFSGDRAAMSATTAAVGTSAPVPPFGTKHKNPLENTCPICRRMFSRSWLLKGHMRTHTGERPYHCSYPTCHKAFADRSNLRSHMLTHTAAARSFSCPRCGKTFSQKRYLHKHMLEVCKLQAEDIAQT